MLPTPADASYPSPWAEVMENHGILSTIKSAICAGPLNGPRHLLDSNIDWGQDLFYLEDWCESHPEARPIKVAYFGGYPLDRSKVESAGFPPVGPDRVQMDDKTDPAAFGPLPGWYALSVNEIYGRSQQYRYFLHFEPVATAGYSIYIYHITLDEANRCAPGIGFEGTHGPSSRDCGWWIGENEMSPSRRGQVSAVDLLLAIAVIAIPLMLLPAALLARREDARLRQCQDNLRPDRDGLGETP